MPNDDGLRRKRKKAKKSDRSKKLTDQNLLELEDGLKSFLSRCYQFDRSVDACECGLNALDSALADSALWHTLDNRARSHLRSIVRGAMRAGFTLVSHPRHWHPPLLREWIGDRFLWLHQSALSRSSDWASIVSSHIGRYGAQVPDWPTRLQTIFQEIEKRRQVYLAVSNTTLYRLAKPWCTVSGLPYFEVIVPARKSLSLMRWLLDRFDDIALDPLQAQRKIHLSPECSSIVSNVPLSVYPLQDRVAWCMSAFVHALILKSGSKSAALFSERVQDVRFPYDSIRVWAQSESHVQLVSVNVSNLPIDSEETAKGLLEEDCLTSRWNVGLSLGNRLATESIGVQQLTMPIRLLDEREYLVHCVRGNPGCLSDQLLDQYLLDAWRRGELPSTSPLDSLIAILQSGRLRGSIGRIRTSGTMVSFSAVPASQLVQHRYFASHLGRWDWEPYGLLIRRQSLQDLGARPVLYGDTDMFQQLDIQQRGFFQPSHRTNRKRTHRMRTNRTPTNRQPRSGDALPNPGRLDWIEEREWRFPGILNLRLLPENSVIAMVQYRDEAELTSRSSDWPVTWLHDQQTDSRQVRSAWERYVIARTNRN